jgi:hypothetical protein
MADKRQDFQEAQPGLMVFHTPPYTLQGPYRKLVIFLVGESPTAGINARQFENAKGWINALRDLDKLGGAKGSANSLCSLCILGPTFSGSLPSLAGVLDPKGGNAIISGSVTSTPDINWFRKLKGVRFAAFQENDDLVINRYCRLLTNLGYHKPKLAILSEDQTAYGYAGTGSSALSECEQKDGGPLELYYPRDIASLRSAYAKQSPVGGGQSAQQNAGRLPENLSESGVEQRNAVRTYGGEQTPLSQESTLFEVVDLLKQHRIEFILLKTSNVLDDIFLTDFFTRTYSEARIVILNSDLMFRRSTATQGFRGTMTLSTYPLLPWEQDWTFPEESSPQQRHRAFADANSEGLYVATRFLIQSIQNQVWAPQFDPPLKDYGPPSWLPNHWHKRPPTWLSVLGAGQAWPIAVIDEETPSSPASTLPEVDTGANPGHAELKLPRSIRICFITAFLWSWWHLASCWYVGNPWRIQSWPCFPHSPGLWYRVLVFFGCMLLALLPIIFSILTVRPGPTFARVSSLSLYIFFFFLFVLSWAALIGAYVRAPDARARPSTAASIPTCATEEAKFWLEQGPVARWMQENPRKCIGAGGVLFLLVAALIFYEVMKVMGDDATGIFTVWRSVNLFNGVSPLTPLLLLVAGGYGWFWYTVKGLALFNDDRPRLPKTEDLGDRDRRNSMLSLQDAGGRIEQAAKPFDAFYVMAVASLFLILFLTLPPLVRSLGTEKYALVYSLWLCFYIALIFADAWQMRRIWTPLRELLHRLDRLPLRRTLDAIQEFSWGTVWKMSGDAGHRDTLLSRQDESLGHLRNQLEVAQLDPGFMAQLDKSRSAFEKYANCRDSSVADLDCLANAQKELAKTAGAFYKQILRPQWDKEKQSLIQDLSQPHPESAASDTRKLSFPSIPEYQRQAEEFFALSCLAFIQNILGRMRTIASGGLWLFMTATISVVSYPFDPRPLLDGIFLFLFVLVGVIIFIVYSEIHRNTTLSHITNTTPGQLGWAFWGRIVTLGIGPLLALLAALFPEMAGVLTSWLEPSVQAIK